MLNVLSSSMRPADYVLKLIDKAVDKEDKKMNRFYCWRQVHATDIGGNGNQDPLVSSSFYPWPITITRFNS